MDYEKYKENIRRFYTNLENVWPKNNRWHHYTHKTIDTFVKEHIKSIDDINQKIINIGSGGNTYGLKQEMYHMDIAENKICHFPHYAVGSADKIPFADNMFDICICVGTVINYCNAKKAVSEMKRVLKPKGKIILEFENSNNSEFKKFENYGKDIAFIDSEYFGSKHYYWVYSFDYICGLLESEEFNIIDSYFFHIVSAYMYAGICNEYISSFFSAADPLLQKSRLKKHCANIILSAVKGDYNEC